MDLSEVIKNVIFVYVLASMICIGWVLNNFYYGRADFAPPLPIKLIGPHPRFNLSDVMAYSDRYCVSATNITLSTFTPTGSMLPFIDENSIGVEIDYTNQTLYVGDVIVYLAPDNDSIVHRVKYIRNDSEGVYYIVKGDNNIVDDDVKVRPYMIQRILIGAIY